MPSRSNTNFLSTFNQPNTLVIISSFPSPKGEVAHDNAVARYTWLLAKAMPHDQQVVIISERRSSTDQPYLFAPNILILPTYRVGQFGVWLQVTTVLKKLSAVSKVLVQSELSVFGSPVTTFSMAGWISFWKMLGKHTQIMLHQVVSDVSELGGHVTTNPIKATILNTALKTFYRGLALGCDKLLVHDSALKNRLQTIVGNTCPIKVIPHGIDVITTQKSKTAARTHWKIPRDAKVVLAYGYHSRYKGTDWIAATVGELAQKYPQRRLHLVLAGDLSPTQRHQSSYKEFATKLDQIIKQYKDVITTTGFVPETKVESLFEAVDVVVFPYRGRMSASGALSLAWQYHKPFLLSRECQDNLKENDVATAFKTVRVHKDTVVFALNENSFLSKLEPIFDQTEIASQLRSVGKLISQERAWTKVAQIYLTA